MSETTTAQLDGSRPETDSATVRAAAGAEPRGPRPALDDIMIAMDVVDTLRHDENLALRELDESARRAELVTRLRDIYRGQGIEVPDRILEQGVEALAQDRFVYKPPVESVVTMLARWYVTRWDWGRYLGGACAALILIWAAHTVFVAWPRASLAAETEHALTVTLPAAFERNLAAVVSEARVDHVAEQARALATAGRNAITARDIDTARRHDAELAALLADLRRSYRVRIVNRSGELTGLWRVPKVNPSTYNFYLVVEAIDEAGNALALSIDNEETGRRATVKTWAVRVPREVLVAVEADKRDDGLIQNAIVGEKRRGEIERTWSIQVAGGTITEW